MTTLKAALLFVGNPTLALEHFVPSLATRLTALGIQAEEISPQNGATIAFRTAGVTVCVTATSAPLAADNFQNSMSSPLSRPVIGILAETLARHSRHIMVSVSASPADAPDPANLLMRLKIAHATTSLLAEWHMPAAVHWRQSNQLLSGAQYLQLASDPSPWVLFAKARVIPGGEPDQMQRSHALELAEAVDFIGRPVRFAQTNLPLDQVHAAALSFLRHAAETGAPIPDGNSFGPKGGTVFRAHHIAASKDLPEGCFELSVVRSDPDTALGAAARTPKAILLDPELPLPVGHPLAGVAAPHPRERTRAMAIGYLMLVIMPPVGAILLMSNAIFGSNVFRTGVVAAASVVLAVAVGAYAFVNNGRDSAALFDNDIIRSVVLAD